MPIVDPDPASFQPSTPGESNDSAALCSPVCRAATGGAGDGRAERASRDDISPARRYHTLLAIAESIAHQRELPALFRRLADVLKPVVPFEFLAVVLHDEQRQTLSLNVLEPSDPAGAAGMAPEWPVDGSAGGRVVVTQQPLVIRDAALVSQDTELCGLLRANAVRACVLLPLTTAHRRVGVLGLGAATPGAYEAADFSFLQQVANQVAVAVDNAHNFDVAERRRVQLEHERDRWRVLLEVNNALVTNLELPALFDMVAPALRRVINFDMAGILLRDRRVHALRVAAVYPAPASNYQEHLGELPPIDITSGPFADVLAARRSAVLDRFPIREFGGPALRELADYDEGRSVCLIPLVSSRRTLGVLVVAARGQQGFAADDRDLLERVGTQIAIAIENALAYQEISELTDRLSDEKVYLEGEIRQSGRYEEIVGDSGGLRRVMAQVETVAPTDSTVLLLGETGTGKEIVARAIHDLSPRARRTLVRVNCAAIPSGLLESELFGHEKGAFTGALARKIGRFELADGGTILLDEVADIPLELQPKLLRVLQEREFERLGSSRSIKVNVRVVAATNRDLAAMVAERQFRSDLFYRLNVFPIALPPLRERREDIPLLVGHFVRRHAQRLKKSIDRIAPLAMDALTRWDWPGNVRELENVIERAVILSRNGLLEIPPSMLSGQSPLAAAPSSPAPSADNLEAVERAHILAVLKQTHWVIGGPGGAAARLGLKRTTLASRMKKLGIRRDAHAR